MSFDAIAQPTPQAIQQRYWQIANDPNERGYVQVRALDSLSKLLDLFPRPKRDAYFAAPPPEPPPRVFDPSIRPSDVVLMTDEELDAYMAKEDAEAAAKAKSESSEEEDDPSNPDEDEPP